MRYSPPRAMILLLALFAVLGAGDAPRILAADPAISVEQERFFEQRIRPLLAEKCWKCHGAEKQESDLRLDRRESWVAKGSTGQPISVPGEVGSGMALAAIGYAGDIRMPPDAKLSAEQIQTLTEWVRMGLPWPSKGNTPAAPLTAGERAAADRQSHWAYQPVVRPLLPAVRQAGWASTEFDVHILAGQEAERLTPSPEADRRTLMRRATFDLIGLPPDPDDVDAFANDAAPDAYARLVDRLLASPRFGERWGRHWLDLARYADTKGYAFAQERRYPYAYTYRDYVIRALNADLPYDRFVREQLAADLLPVPEDKSTLAALGFLTTGRRFNNIHDDIDDRIDVVGRGLLGLTTGCARCHDHKYDAIPIEDYYSLYGVFASAHEPGELPLIGSPVENAAYQAFQADLGKLQGEIDAYRNQMHAEMIDVARQRTADYLARTLTDKPDSLLAKLDKLPFLSLGPNDLRRKLVDRWRDYIKRTVKADHPVFGPWHDLAAIAATDKPGETFPELAAPILAKWQAMAEGTAPGQVNPLVKAALAAEPPAAQVELARVYGKLLGDTYQQWRAAGGNPEAEAKLAEPARQVLQILTAQDSPTNIPIGEVREFVNRAERNKLNDLQKKVDAFQASSPAAPPRAMVLFDNANPTKPRVFLRGNPARPGPEVDRQFLRVLSPVERQPFQKGSGRLELAEAITSPDNPLTRRVIANRLWMHHLGEPLVATPSNFGVRTERPLQHGLLDALAAALLDRQWSLKSLHREIMLSSTFRQASLDRADCRAIDPENRRYWRMNRRRLEFESLRDSLLAAANRLDRTMYGRAAELTRPPYSYRRAIYGYIDRQDLPNLFRVFDLASPDQSSDKRPRTIVPQQALFLMNSPFVVEQARALVARPEVAGIESTDGRVTALYRTLFGRDPQPEELDVARQFVASAGDGVVAGSPLTPWQQYAQLLLLTNEMMFVD